jgi:hypothetical protein
MVVKYDFLHYQEECRIRVLANRILRRIDANEEWRKFHNEELDSLHSSSNIVRTNKSRRLIWAGHVDRMEGGRSAFKVLTCAPTGKRHLGRPRRRWDENIRMDLQ